MKIQLLGSPTISFAHRLLPTFKTAKAAALFYYLVTTQRTYARATLATLFWGDMTETKARVNLSKALSELREQMGDYVTIATQTVTFNTALPYELDVATFLTAAPPYVPDEALALLQDRANLYRGEFLEGFYVRNAPDFEQWLLVERERLRSAAVQLFAHLATGYQQCGQTTAAINTLQQLVRIEPWREAAHHQLMELLVLQGETQAALRQYEICRTALADELAVEPGEAITRLYTRLRLNGKSAGAGEEPAAPSLPVPPASGQAAPALSYYLPQPPTPFVGRAAEIKTLVDQLCAPTCRLVTLVGPGGIGKTRLALAVGRHLVDTAFATPMAPTPFAEGIFFVDLMPVDSAAGMIAAIAEALGFTFYTSAPPQQQLFNYLKARRLLLLLDNFEQLVQESALLSALLTAAPGVKLLVTSRDALPLQAAYFHSVQGLPYPDVQTARTEASTTDAVQLFAQCAHRHQPAMILEQQMDAVMTICRLVGGLPLALELAATWLKSLSCTQIAQELAKNSTLLRTNVVDIPERHRDMRMVFAQSWQRLTPAEAAVMERLALFRGGFTLAAAEAVAQASIYTLASLTEKALIRLDESGRYQIHELLRQFAYDKLLVGKVQVETSAAAHASFFLSLAAQLKTDLTARHQQSALATLQADIDNLRTAWFWALQQPELPGIAAALESLYMLFLFTSRYSEGKELFITSAMQLESATIAQTSQTIDLASQSASRAAVFAYHLGEYEQPLRHFHSLLSTTSAGKPSHDIALAYLVLGRIASWQDRHKEAVSLLQQSVALFTALGDHSNLASVQHGLAETYAHAADYQNALDCAQACLDIGIQLGRDDLIGSAHYTIGYALRSLGQFKLALHHYQQGCVYTQKTGDRLGYALSVGGVGIELSRLGQKHWAQGFALAQQSLAICRELGYNAHIVTRLLILGRVCIFGKRYDQTLPFAEECLQIASETNRGAVYGVWLLGENYYEMGNLALSRHYLHRTIRVGIEYNYRELPAVLVVYSLLLDKEASQLTAAQALQNRTAAVTLATAALQRPCWYEYHQRAEQLLERQKAILDADQFAAAQVLAGQQTLEVLAIQIIERETDNRIEIHSDTN